MPKDKSRWVLGSDVLMLQQILISVQTFSVPKAPKSPEEADLANDLKTYETQSVDVEGSAEGGEGAEAVSDEWFEEEEEAAPAAAH
jgi:F-type H+-transporting ATPase subunit h